MNTLPYMVKELCNCDFIKDLELRRLSWIIPVDPISLQGSLEGKETGESESEDQDNRSRARRDVIAGFEDGRGQKPRDAAASIDCKMQGSRFTPRVSRKNTVPPISCFFFFPSESHFGLLTIVRESVCGGLSH